MDNLLQNMWNRIQEYAPHYFPIHDAVREHFSQLESRLDTVLTTSQVFQSTPEVAKDLVHKFFDVIPDIHAVITKLLWLKVSVNAIHDHTPVSYLVTQHFKLWESVDEIIKLAMKDTNDNYSSLLRDYRLGRLPKVHDIVLQSVPYENQCKAIRELLCVGAVATLKKNHHFTQHTFRNFCIPCAKLLIKYSLFENYEDTRPVQRYWSQYKSLKSYIEDCLRQLRGFCDERVNDVPIIQFIWMPYKAPAKPQVIHQLPRCEPPPLQEEVFDDELMLPQQVFEELMYHPYVEDDPLLDEVADDDPLIEEVADYDPAIEEIADDDPPIEEGADNNLPIEEVAYLDEENATSSAADMSHEVHQESLKSLDENKVDAITDTSEILAVLKILEEQQHTVFSNIIMENLKRRVDRETLTKILESTSIYCYDHQQQFVQLPIEVICMIGKLLSFNTMASLIAAYTLPGKPVSEYEAVPGSSKEGLVSEYELLPGSSKKRQIFAAPTSSKKQDVSRMTEKDDGPIATRLRHKKFCHFCPHMQ